MHTLRVTYFLALATAAAAVLLAAFCFAQIPARVGSTPQAVQAIEKQFEIGGAATRELKTFLQGQLDVVKENDQATARAHIKLWIASVLGFCGLAVTSGIAAYLARRALRRFGGVKSKDPREGVS